MVLWAKEVATRRGKPIAITALARKLAGILRALWVQNTVYDPFHHATSKAATTEPSPS
jgi:hypothetical protein